MTNTCYPSDLTGQQVEQIKPCLYIQRRSKWSLLSLINAILYVCAEGIKWRALPKEQFPPWQTAYWYFAKWTKDGSWQAVNEELVMVRRQSSGAAALPQRLAIDTQSVKNTATATVQTGTDGGKKIKGRKRMLLVDSSGNLLAVKVFAANCHDGPVAWRWWRDELSGHAFFEQAALIRGDQHYGGMFKKSMEAAEKIKVEISKEPIDRVRQQGMPVHKGRWVVERTIAWESFSRRLSKDYERKTVHAEAFLIISSISRLLRKPICLN